MSERDPDEVAAEANARAVKCAKAGNYDLASLLLECAELIESQSEEIDQHNGATQ